MGRRGRRQVLQLGDSSDGFLAKYGYNRQEEDVPGGNEDSEEEAEDDAGSIAPPAEINKPKENGDHIDSQVANFLAQLEHEDSNDSTDRPGFVMDPEAPPSFKLNPDQKISHSKDTEPTYVSNKARSMYKNMFVKGDSEFTGRSDKEKSMTKKEIEVEWPEEPTTVWQQTLDDNTQCYYYWNTVTNEVTWEIPPDFTQYLLQMKSYEEKVAKLQKEGKVKPVKKVEPEATIPLPEPRLPPEDKSSSEVPAKKKETIKPETEVKDDNRCVDSKSSSTSSSKKALSALAAYADSDAESSASESGGEDDKKKKTKKKDSDEDIDLDLDDIDKALEVALEKKKPGKDSNSPDKKDGKSKSEPKPPAPKKLTLIDSIKEQIKLKQETEARRKAAIEEMMARELERRVGPPRKRSTEEETVWDSKRPKIVDYGHSRSRSPVIETSSRSDDRDSRRRHDSHRDRDSDRHGHKEKKKKKDKDKEDRHHRDEKRRDHDKHEKEHKDRKKDKKKDKEEKRREKDERREKDDRREKDERRDKDDRKDRDDKKERDRDKEKDRDRERKKDRHEDREKKNTEKDSEKQDKKTTEEAEKTEIKTKEMKIEKEENSDEGKDEEITDIKPEVEEKPPKKSLDVDIDAELENIVTGTIKADVELANKKMQASELADLALSKLEFLEVTKKGLSKLQILLVELETRHQDWQAGGLNTEFYIIKLEEANWQLEQYERSAAPPGWSCHWDRSYRRYFYMNKRTKQTQWDYPDEDEEEEEEEDVRDSSPDQDIVPSVNKEPVKTATSQPESEVVTSTTPEQEEVTTTKDVVSSTKETEDESQNTVPQKSGQSWPDYEAVTNYISGTEYSGVIRGEPPPPGTDLEFLLTAPPPPPPPVEENMEDETYSSYDVQGPPEGHLPSADQSNVDDIDGEIMPDESDFQQETEVSESDGNIEMKEQYDETETVPADPSIIARPPQIFTDNPYQSYYDPSALLGEQYQGQYYSEGGVDVPVAMETAAIGDAAILQQEKERKKKKKEKQSSGQLKNKNVSNLVQKWQKVKKEVEIEEQQREERQQAIRQKLDEWKKEHS